jgi:hypothetical protein
MRLKKMVLRLAACLLAGFFICIPFRSVCYARVRYQYYDTPFRSFITDEDSVAEMKQKVMIIRSMLEDNKDIIELVLNRIPKNMRHEESDAYWSIFIHYDRHHYKVSGKQYKTEKDDALINDLRFLMDVYVKKYEIRRIEKKIRRREILGSFLAFIKIKPPQAWRA